MKPINSFRLFLLAVSIYASLGGCYLESLLTRGLDISRLLGADDTASQWTSRHLPHIVNPALTESAAQSGNLAEQPIDGPASLYRLNKQEWHAKRIMNHSEVAVARARASRKHVRIHNMQPSRIARRTVGRPRLQSDDPEVQARRERRREAYARTKQRRERIATRQATELHPGIAPKVARKQRSQKTSRRKVVPETIESYLMAPVAHNQAVHIRPILNMLDTYPGHMNVLPSSSEPWQSALDP